MLKKEIFINSTSEGNRIAIVEDSKLTEIYFEHPEHERVIGDIWLGRVAKVIPGIKAAFIDLGLKQDAFLHFSDVSQQVEDFKALVGDDDSDIDDEDDVDEDEPHNNNQFQRRYEPPRLERDQNIIVQITKEPVANKGVRVTSKISLPGRYLVLIPFEGKINASKKIYNLREKRRLKYLARNFRKEKGSNYGAIIRTVAENKPDAEILEDLSNLVEKWKEIEKKVKSAKPPLLLHKDLSTTSSVIRDIFRDDVSRLVVDNKKLHKEITDYLSITSPGMLNRLELYKGSTPLFDSYGIDKETQKAFDKKIEFKSGAYIFIEQTEAMFVIDVNSGKYARSKDQETNSLKTNLEAAREIVRQIRLRDLGGIIVIDFIDVYDNRNKKKVYDELLKEFHRDRAKVTVLPMSEFGIVQITRQRIRHSAIKSISEPCPMCGGTGIVETSGNIITRIEKWMKRFKSEMDKKHSGKVQLHVNPIIYKELKAGTISKITKLAFKYLIRVKLVEDSSLNFQNYKFVLVKTGEDITHLYS